VLTKVQEEPSKASRKNIWISSCTIALLGLGGVMFFEDRWFAAVLVFAASVHLVLIAVWRIQFTWALLFSQALIVAAALSSVVGYVYLTVGPAQEGWSTVMAFIRSWPDTQIVASYGQRLAVFLGVVVVVALAWRLILRRPLRSSDILVLGYSATALAVPCGYSLERPLYHAGGDLEATHFFFAAGIFGVEFPLLLYVVSLIAALLGLLIGRERAGERVVASHSG
jgi:hypothetical protein